jgi:hypothetical protein
MFVGVYFLNDYFKSKYNPIYFKQVKIIQNVMFIFTLKKPNAKMQCFLLQFLFLLQ